MYKFVIRNASGKRLYTSIRDFWSVSDAQIGGNNFLQTSRDMDNRAVLSAKGNYVDVI